MRSHGKFAAGKEARKWLMRGSRTYLGDLVLYCDSLNRRLGTLEYSLEHGRPREPYYASFTGTDWEMYVRGMANFAHLLLPDVMKRIRLPRGKRRCAPDQRGSRIRRRDKRTDHPARRVGTERRWQPLHTRADEGSTAAVVPLGFHGAHGWAQPDERSRGNRTRRLSCQRVVRGSGEVYRCAPEISRCRAYRGGRLGVRVNVR